MMHGRIVSEAELQLLKDLDEALQTEFNARDQFGQVAQRLLPLLDVSEPLSNEAAIIRVVQSPTGADGQLVVAALVQFLGIRQLEFWQRYQEEQADFRAGMNRLVERYLGRTLKMLDVDKSAQAHEKVDRLSEAAGKAFQIVEDAFRPIDRLNQFPASRQTVMRAFNQALVQELVAPLLPVTLRDRDFNVAFEQIREYRDTSLDAKAEAFAAAERELNSIIREVAAFSPTRFSRVVEPYLNRLLKALRGDFASTGLSKPADLTVQPVDKRYPFGVLGARINLGLSVQNSGEGVALETELRITDADKAIDLVSRVRRLAQIAPGERIEPIEFTVSVEEATASEVPVMCQLRWVDGTGTEQHSPEILLTFAAQPADIPWKELETSDPYSLEPVSKAKDLVGRQGHVDSLVSRIRSPSVGSTWVYGQKRVGKTSLVRTLSDLASLDDHQIVYVEAGDVVAPSSSQTINALGRRICKELAALDDRFRAVTVPEFDGALAPLVEFLEDCLRLVPDFRIVTVIDEFDELPASLYKRGGDGDALFLTIRSISGKDSFGFILVGGERMSAILESQGEALNKFKALSIGYLSSTTQWSDFVELVRHPLRPWAEVQDDAIRTLYEYTAGNPFFTKYVCGILFEDMLERRDAHATVAEMRTAIARAVEHAGQHQFQHFWGDGIGLDDAEALELEQARRRTVLLAFAELDGTGDSLSPEKVAARAASYSLLLDERGAERVIKDFLRRGILVETDEELDCRVRLFREWLKESGRLELSLSLAKEADLRADLEDEEKLIVKSGEIVELTKGWPMYQGRRVGPERVRAWLNQFATPADQRCAFEILCGVEFYGDDRIREALRTGHASVKALLAQAGIARKVGQGTRKVKEPVLISWYGPDGKSGHGMARAYADENQLYFDSIIAPDSLAQVAEGALDARALVFVDDLIGSGDTAKVGLTSRLDSIATALAEKEIRVVVVAIAGFVEGQNRVLRSLHKLGLEASVFIVNPLDNTNRCFHEETSLEFDLSSRARAKRMATKYGRQLVERFPLGYDEGQLTVTYSHNCPNNSLPILWSSKNGWIPLFPRS